ncbi:hypothetical protein BJA5080_05169 [Bradyrhizobium diazoefficiens SEMIA 5080]|uniref:Uncharacterized protein n=1 Tax=Bradyrhizobium diazoefficiens SEMIA 5080 TaxID=754504 RepID=A0A837C2X5_9BRAD|nr:hypothetical protein BJA5080_05169 [Bradyrhizobium diazoefficiens SEMIA 5080]
MIIRGRKNDDSNGRIAVSQFAEDREAISVRQIDIKQDEADVGMFLDYVHCLTAARSFKYDGLSLQLSQDRAQRLAYQCMIVNNKDFHEKLSVIPWHGDPI